MRYPPPDHKANKWLFERDDVDGSMVAVMVSVAHVHRGPGTMRYVYGATMYRLVEADKIGKNSDWREWGKDVITHQVGDHKYCPGRLPFIRKYNAALIDDVLADASAI